MTAALHEYLNCLGHYGFANGYTIPEGKRYCDMCPVNRECWKKLRSQVENDDPEMTDKFHQLVLNIAAKRLISLDRAAAYATSELLKFGTPDPYMKVALANMDRGMDKRRQDDPGVENRKVGRPAG